MPFRQLATRDPLIVAGIDPGTHLLGFGVVGRKGSLMIAVDHGALRAPKDAGLCERMKVLARGLRALFAHHKPDVIALEEAFVARNIQSSLRLGEARGMVLCIAAELDIPVVDYPTARVKVAIAGHGGATKQRVRTAVMRELRLLEAPDPLDASDALALALALLHDPRMNRRLAAALSVRPRARKR